MNSTNRIALDEAYVNAKTDTGEVLVDLSESGRKRPWAEKKVMSLKVAALYKKAMGNEELLTNERYKSLLQCGDSLLFGVWRTGREEKADKGKFLSNKAVSDVQLAKVVEDVQSSEPDQRGATERKIGNKVFVLDANGEKCDRRAFE